MKRVHLVVLAGVALYLLWPKRGSSATVAGQGGDNGPSSSKAGSCQPYIDPQSGVLTIPICY